MLQRIKGIRSAKSGDKKSNFKNIAWFPLKEVAEFTRGLSQFLNSVAEVPPFEPLFYALYGHNWPPLFIY